MKILITHSYFLNFDLKQLKAGNAYPPLGTLVLASLLRENRFEVSLFDTMFSENPSEIIEHINAENPQMLIICDDGFNYLTKMCLSNMREAAFEMIKLAKEKGLKVVVNSSDASDHYEEYINKGADYVVLGESEPSVLELLNALEDQNAHTLIAKIQNIVFKKYGAIVKNGRREVMKDLDSLPTAAWDLIDIDRYKSFWINNKGYFSLNMVTTRGCPYKCNWCAKPIYGNRYNTRSPEKVIDEIKYLVNEFQINHIWFADDIFGLKPGWLFAFAALVEKNAINIKYKIQSRADLLTDEESIKALAASGCDEVWLGAESGSQPILDAMDKGITINQIYQSRKLLKKYGIKTAFFLQFGYLGETQQDVDSTIKMVLDLMPEDIGISVSYPLPGTKFYDKVKADLNEKTNWTDSDELAMMFENTYPKAYYKQLQKYVHSVYRYHKNLGEINRYLHGKPDNQLKTLRKAIAIPYHFVNSLYYKSKLNRLKTA